MAAIRRSVLALQIDLNVFAIGTAAEAQARETAEAEANADRAGYQ